MISGEMRKYEGGIAEEIRKMGRGKQMWKMIKKLKGEKSQKVERVKLFTEEGEELHEERYEQEVRGFWQAIYQMHGNDIERRWGTQEKEEYKELLVRTRRREEDPEELWLPRIGDPYRNVRTMKFEVEEEGIRKILRDMKRGKAGGLDGLKPELYKALERSEVVVGALKEGIEKIVTEGGEPDEWREYRTVMIPKKKKPTVGDLRPIALTDVSYKMVMKEAIERHLERSGMVRWEQAGFTSGGEVLDNLLILQECIRKTYREKEQLVVVAVDFRRHTIR